MHDLEKRDVVISYIYIRIRNGVCGAAAAAVAYMNDES